MALTDALDQLTSYAERRGFRRWVAVVITVVGGIPAALVTFIRRPGLEDAPLIGALFVFVPAILLAGWSYLDHEGRAARELVMWLRVVRRALTDDDAEVPLNDLPTVPPQEELAGLQMRETAMDYREVLAALVASPRMLGVRIGVYRYWYVIVWAVSSALLVIGFIALVPR